MDVRMRTYACVLCTKRSYAAANGTTFNCRKPTLTFVSTSCGQTGGEEEIAYLAAAAQSEEMVRQLKKTPGRIFRLIAILVRAAGYV